MATYTDNYQLTKPLYSETADVAAINNNMDKIDDIMHASQVSLAPAYDQYETYNTGDVVMYEFLMYECLEDEVTGVWDATKWQRTTAGEHGGGSSASEVSYDNTDSGMTATNVQDAIDELQSEIEDIPSVEANPQGEATEELTKIGIGNTIYAIVGGETIYGKASGAVASFSDGSANPLVDLKININAVQSGSGTPSPNNPMPISGWTGAEIRSATANMSDFKSLKYGNGSLYNLAEGTTLNLSDTATYVSASFTDNSVSVTNTTNWRGIAIISEPVKAGVTYRRMYNLNTSNSANTKNTMYLVDDEFKIVTMLDRYASMNSGDFNTTFTPTADNLRFVECIEASTQFTFTITNYMWCESSQASVVSDYEAYDTTTYPISWQTEAGEVFGGTLDVTSGELTITHGYIASYDGETINEPWISSIDEYVAGTTPSTGAEVVYPLTTPITESITPTQITALLGTNNIWADCGDSEVEYIRDINKAFNILWNAVMNQSNTRSLSMAKSINTENTKETEEEIKKEGNDENQR